MEKMLKMAHYLQLVDIHCPALQVRCSYILQTVLRFTQNGPTLSAISVHRKTLHLHCEASLQIPAERQQRSCQQLSRDVQYVEYCDKELW